MCRIDGSSHHQSFRHSIATQLGTLTSSRPGTFDHSPSRRVGTVSAPPSAHAEAPTRATLPWPAPAVHQAPARPARLLSRARSASSNAPPQIRGAAPSRFVDCPSAGLHQLRLWTAQAPADCPSLRPSKQVFTLVCSCHCGSIVCVITLYGPGPAAAGAAGGASRGAYRGRRGGEPARLVAAVAAA